MKKSILSMLLLSLLLACKSQYPDLDAGLYADIQTDKGAILVKLAHEEAPITVANFVSLSEGTNPIVSEEFKSKKFYNGLKFHRVIADFMIQGGCPLGTGTGGPGYRFGDEFNSTLRHDGPGKFSMANAGPGTNGSQFFITHVATPWLDDAHTIFGAVQTDADQDIVNAIIQGDHIVAVTIEGDSAELLASVSEVQEWNAQLDA